MRSVHLNKYGVSFIYQTAGIYSSDCSQFTGSELRKFSLTWPRSSIIYLKELKGIEMRKKNRGTKHLLCSEMIITIIIFYYTICILQMSRLVE